MVRFNADGSLAWAKSAQRSSDNYDLRPVAATGLSDGSSLVTSSFEDTAVFGPGELKETSLTAENQFDVFVMKMTP